MTSEPRTPGPERPVDVPIVSIGLPTYNRVRLLRTAVESLLRQDHPRIEVIVSDNASSDGTEEFCRSLAERDPRVRYVRQPRNIGLTANYAAVFAEARGDYFMNMADDDAPDPSYVSRCVAALEADPGLVVACGRPLMCSPDAAECDAVRTNLEQESGAERVVAFYATVQENAAFEGVMRRAVAARAPRMRNTMGGDWLHMAAIAFMGRIRTLDGPAIRKQIGGTSKNTLHMARQMGMPLVLGIFPMESIMLSAFADIAWRCPVFAPLGRRRRLGLALRVLWTLFRRFNLRRLARLSGRSAGTGAPPR